MVRSFRRDVLGGLWLWVRFLPLVGPMEKSSAVGTISAQARPTSSERLCSMMSGPVLVADSATV